LRVPAPAQTFPERIVKLIVPVHRRLDRRVGAASVTLRMQAILGHAVIVENQPGGGLIAARAVAAANPDGYTLLIGGIGRWPSALVKTPDFTRRRAFTPIAAVSTETMVLVVNPKVLADSSMPSFARQDERRQAQLRIGPGMPRISSPNCSAQDRRDIVHLPYKGAGPAITISSPARSTWRSQQVGVLQLVKQGRLRALGTAQHAGPNCPSVRHLPRPAFFPYPLEVWWGIVGPAGPAALHRGRGLNGAINAALQSTELAANLPAWHRATRRHNRKIGDATGPGEPRGFDIIRMTGIKME